MAYYIVNPNADIHMVWNHRLGGFAVDFDAMYDCTEFGYASKYYARSRAKSIMDTQKCEGLVVCTRKQLFEYLGLF